MPEVLGVALVLGGYWVGRWAFSRPIARWAVRLQAAGADVCWPWLRGEL